MALVIAIGAVAVATRDDPEPQFRLAIPDLDRATPTSSLTPPVEQTTVYRPAPSPAPPPRANRRGIVADRDGKWALYADPSNCVELVLTEATFERLLCGAAAVEGSIGSLVSVNSPVGRIAVAIADPAVSGFGAFARAGGNLYPDGGQAGVDPGRPKVAYVAGLVSNTPGSWVDVTLQAGDQLIGKFLLPPEDRAYRPAELHLTASKTWPNYRKAGNFGYFFAGNQDLGFYDGASGRTCLLYRRIGGPSEKLLVDACPPAGAHVAGGLAPVDERGFENKYLVAAMSDVGANGLRLELPDGGGVGTQVTPAKDPKSTWIGLAEFAMFIEIPPGVRTVTFVLTQDAREVGRAQVAVPGR